MTLTISSIGLLSKIATILQMIDGAPLNKQIDRATIQPLLADGEVSSWLDAMDAAGLIDGERVR